jgi:hypothetical protein
MNRQHIVVKEMAAPFLMPPSLSGRKETRQRVRFTDKSNYSADYQRCLGGTIDSGWAAIGSSSNELPELGKGSLETSASCRSNASKPF